ncbi:MAG: GIY-YIG nuclease family protein [Candidatus Falkowbacteria bacterium]
MVRTPGFSAGGGSAFGGHPTFMYYLYILQSLKDFGYYIGITSDLEKRTKEHNSGKTKSIKNRIPFTLKYKESYNNKTEARKREIDLKRNYQKRKELLLKIGFKIK